MRRALVILGTRPEAIKLGPVIVELQKPDSGFQVRVCVTGQHRDLLAASLRTFGIVPDDDLASMRLGQSLASSASRILAGLEAVIGRRQPDVVVVQGDTTSTFCGALAAFYSRIPVAHVEAGLRTDRPDSPFPEEMNRRLSTRLAVLHLAATEWAANNLLAEGVAAEAIRVTGNPGIDALLSLRATRRQSPTRRAWPWRDRGKRLITVTAHRRENFGHGLEGICEAVHRLAQRPDVEVAWPLHPNPDVRRVVLSRLSSTPNISLLPPLDYPDFIDLLAGSDLTLTDSGGVQEEAPSLGTPALVLRESTERPEAIEAGTSILVGSEAEKIVAAAARLLDDRDELRWRSRVHNPYGDGCAAPIIAAALCDLMGLRKLAAAG
ncbi:MAG: UDP-N-acetylglucosamine 2-epimerase (non-hydrolyzing) [Acidobacteria bacterium]|nr:UDP-N-acetylglucosamine 2-epimerase (non-hydrolyzing) [Acidobacteriota bacterium]MDA1233650.1 UDP-N-acetylglucosamine 2-epimerase (non-hydrolyzing) [Acidobacteriota bacterium]